MDTANVAMKYQYHNNDDTIVRVPNNKHGAFIAANNVLRIAMLEGVEIYFEKSFSKCFFFPPASVPSSRSKTVSLVGLLQPATITRLPTTNDSASWKPLLEI